MLGGNLRTVEHGKLPHVLLRHTPKVWRASARNNKPPHTKENQATGKTGVHLLYTAVDCPLRRVSAKLYQNTAPFLGHIGTTPHGKT